MKILISVLLLLVLLQTDNLSAETYELPFMPRGDDTEHQGFVRIVNLSPASASVSVYGLTDSGQLSNTATFSVPGDGAVHFQVSHFENGSTEKGLTGSIGATAVTDGDWRLKFDSSSSLKVLGYYRSPETGFLTPLHDTSHPAFSGTIHKLYTVNPGSNLNQLGKIRLMNNTASSAQVSLWGTDDAGVTSPKVTISLPAFEVVTATMAELEEGSSNSLISGSFGDGSGKWQLLIYSPFQPISVMSLIFAPNGYLSNMTPEGYDITNNGGRFPVSCDTLDGSSLFGADDHSTYLGFLGTASGTDSIYNSTGDFGSTASSTSINNPATTWGSPIDNFSAQNPVAATPPLIIKHGRQVGRLSVNSGIAGAISPAFAAGCTFSALTRKHPYNPKDQGEEPSEIW